MLKLKDFVHLHNHFDFSLKDSVLKIDQLKDISQMGFKSFAITDHGNIYGWVDFDKKCKEVGIKPIFGVEAYEAPVDVDNKDKNKWYYHSVFLAKNMDGIRFIRKLVTYSNEHIYNKPRYDLKYLLEHKEEAYGNIIWMSACVAGRLPTLLLESKFKEAKEYFQTMQSIFGDNNTFVELQFHKFQSEILAYPLIIKFAKENNFNVVGTNDTHYLNKEDYIAREIMIARTRKQNLDPNIEECYKEMYVKSQEQMNYIFRNVPMAVENTLKISEMIESITLEGKKYDFPKIDLDVPVYDFLKKKSEDRIPEIYSQCEDLTEIKKRNKYELDTMQNMDALPYIALIREFVEEAKKDNISVGLGRGSVCGSEVAYALGITEVDPIRYNLQFERFLNPDRISMPDIDLDIEYERREEIMLKVLKKRGKNKVAKIRNFVKIASRNAIRDVGAVLNIDRNTIDRICKYIPEGEKTTILNELEKNIALKEEYRNNPQIKNLLDKAMKIEGLIKNVSSHAAGLIVSDKPLTEFGALSYEESSELPIFSSDMSGVEYLKLIKIDFLGLKTLTIIKNALNAIKENIDIKNISLDDKNVFNFISSGNTHCVFQFETTGMQNFMKEMRPQNIEDLIAGVALYRPGPKEQIPRYIKNKNNPKSIQYAHPLLENVLNVTYGCMVYQEQVMQIVRDVAGYSLGRADLVRRAISKKKEDVMKKERQNFIYGMVDENGNEIIKGALKNGMSEDVANKIFDEIMDFASYAFNKSHATAYAILSYQTAYLKYYYPVEYTASYLNSILEDNKELKKHLGLAKKSGIKIYRADINKCEGNFKAVDGGILFGLKALKGISSNIFDVIQERKTHGNFKSISDLVIRTNINKKDIEVLTKSGALDSICDRSSLLKNLERILKNIKNTRDVIQNGQICLFDIDEYIDIPKEKPMPEIEKLFLEKEVSGFFISGHPLNLNEYKNFKSTITTVDNFNLAMHGKSIRIYGIIDWDDKEDGLKVSKKGNKYFKFKLEDSYSEIDVVSFSNFEHITKNNIVEVVGTLNIKETKNESNDNDNLQVSIFAKTVYPCRCSNC